MVSTRRSKRLKEKANDNNNNDETIALTEAAAPEETTTGETNSVTEDDSNDSPIQEKEPLEKEQSKDNDDESVSNNNREEEDDEDKEDEAIKETNSKTARIAKISARRRKSLLSNTSTAAVNSNTKNKPKNALTKLVPGYTAPMRLDSSSLDKHRFSIGDLGKRAERSDASTKQFVREATADKIASSMKSNKQGFLPTSYTDSYSRFKKGTKKAPDYTAGKGWFGMAPSAMTEDLKKDLAMIRNRTYLDPKRFYKNTDKFGSVVQVGTVIEGAAEFYSSRLTKKERRQNLTEELMSDPKTVAYTKNKFQNMAKEKVRQAKLRKLKPARKRKFHA